MKESASPVPLYVVATVSPEDLQEYRKFFMREDVFRSVNNCDNPRNEEDLLNCRCSSPAFQAERELLWRKMGEKYGFDCSCNLSIDLDSGDIFLRPV